MVLIFVFILISVCTIGILIPCLHLGDYLPVCDQSGYDTQGDWVATWGVGHCKKSTEFEVGPGPILCSPLCSCEAFSNFFSLPKPFSFSKNENERPAFQSLDDELCA